MYLIVPFLKDAIQQTPHFQSWDVRHNLEAVSRKSTPAVDVRIDVASIKSSDTSMVVVEPVLNVTLVVDRGPSAAQQLHHAFNAAFQAVHGLRINNPALGEWSWLKLVQVRDAPPEGSLVGCEMLFTCSDRMTKQQCDRC